MGLDIGKGAVITPSDVLIFNEHEAEFSHLGDVATKKCELLILNTGTFRFTFEIKNSLNVVNARGQIYKDGVVHGTLRQTEADHTVYQEFTEDLEFEAG
ncbi:unnamed protein product, partial [marine sediment metagenome]